MRAPKNRRASTYADSAPAVKKAMCITKKAPTGGRAQLTAMPGRIHGSRDVQYAHVKVW